MKIKFEPIKSMEYYLQPNDWIIIIVGLLFILAICVYTYYSMVDSEETPVSKEELGYVSLASLIAALCGGALVYVMMLMRVIAIYPPVDGVDMGEPPF